MNSLSYEDFGRSTRLVRVKGEVDLKIERGDLAQARMDHWHALTGVEPGGYMEVEDVAPTDHPQIWHAEWLGRCAGKEFIDRGLVVVYASGATSQVHHVYSMEAAREFLTRDKYRTMDPMRRKKLFSRATHVSRRLLHSLGWCDAGINRWVSEFVPPQYVVDNRMRIEDLRRTIDSLPVDRRDDHYAQTLAQMFAENPRFTS